MTEEIAPENKDALFIANASTFRHSAKISYLQMVHIIIGFAHGTSITAAAKKARAHRDTVRDIYAAFRDRLTEPRFEKWVQSAYASPQLDNAANAALMEEARGALFGCHENIDCQKRYRAGRRTTRLCRACPLTRYARRYEAEESEAEGLVELIDNLRDFYQLLGWKESSGDDARALFEKRFRHYEIFSTAVGHSAFDEDGKVISTEDDFLSILHLAKALTDELKANPLR